MMYCKEVTSSAINLSICVSLGRGPCMCMFHMEIDSVNSFSMRTGVSIGTGSAFLRQRFRFSR